MTETGTPVLDIEQRLDKDTGGSRNVFGFSEEY